MRIHQGFVPSVLRRILNLHNVNEEHRVVSINQILQSRRNIVVLPLMAITASATEIAASTETVGLDEANDAEQALSVGAESLGEYSQGFTNECPNETTLPSLNVTFATAFAKGMFSCENYITMSSDGERLIRRYSHAAV